MSSDGQPLLAIVATALAPYRLRLHTRIAREIPNVRLATLILRVQANQPWDFDPPPEINLEWMEQRDRSGSNTSTVRWNPVGLDAWRQGRRLVRWLERERPAVVVMTGYQDVCRVLVLRWCRRNRVPVYMFSDSNAAGDRLQRQGGWRAALKRRYVSWFVRQVSGLLVCGRGGIDYYRQYGGAAKPYFYVPHEGDYELQGEITSTEVDEARSKFGLNANRRVIVYCGRLVRVKRVDLLLDAFSMIASERPDWDLLIIGDGPLRDDLLARVHPGLRERVVWTGFVNERHEINSLYLASDVFVLPSEYEPWGAVTSEACAAGLAIVSSDVVGSALELVSDGENGRLFRSGNAEALAEALRDVTSENQIESMQTASRSVLADWRRRGDPVDGIRAMLGHAGVLDRRDIQGGQSVEGIALS